MSLSARESPEAKFWTWFGSAHERFRSIDKADDGEELLDLLLEHLHEFDSELFFEVSQPLEDGSNELIISAEGVREKFPKVEVLVAAAPKLPKWQIIAFKPALGFEFVHEYGELKIDPRKLWFLPLIAKSDSSVLGLRVGLPDFDKTAEEKIKNSVWIVLDTGLGEEVCAKRIRHLEVVKLPEKPEDNGYIELPELSAYLAWIDKRNSEQDGADQPATAPESKPVGDQNPKPESEVRPQ
jgi:hypothetical protein